MKLDKLAINRRCFALLVFVPVLVLILFVNSCSLERTNPLDPVGNPSVRVPAQVIGVELAVSSTTANPRFINVSWQRMENVDGYIIYRAYSLHSSFERLVTLTNNEFDDYRDTENIIAENYYWYKISAYNEYPEGRLEGKFSSPQGRRVN
jgi:hypothetical protein